MKVLTEEQRQLFPTNAWLEDYREHCETTHGATADDYRQRVSEWHRENHPRCDAAPKGRAYFGSKSTG